MKLLVYLNGLDPKKRPDFARAVGTTVGHLNNVAYGMRQASAALAKLIATHTGGEVSERELRPNDWHLIWPELVTAEHPAPMPANQAA